MDDDFQMPSDDDLAVECLSVARQVVRYMLPKLAKREPHLADDIAVWIYNYAKTNYWRFQKKFALIVWLRIKACDWCSSYMRNDKRDLARRQQIDDLNSLPAAISNENFIEAMRKAIDDGLACSSERNQEIWLAYESEKNQKLASGLNKIESATQASDSVAKRFNTTKLAVAQAVFRVNKKIREEVIRRGLDL